MLTCGYTAQAQLGFCQGNSGDPIFNEDFGTGTDFGPPLPPGTTSYTFINNNNPQDGEYTLASSTFQFGWNMPNDHTPNDVNGKALVVNADFTTGEFYRTTVGGLCENTTYEFSAWLANILPVTACGGNTIPVNVQFEIWDITDSNLLASGNTGDIFGSSTTLWEQYALVFQSLPGQTSVILKMINNGQGGCGNDLAIDDIIFKSCGDLITVEDDTTNPGATLCSTQAPYSEVITAIPDNAVFNTHFYQWQSSTDGINWTNILGETNASLSISNVTNSISYRAKVAEFEDNLDNEDCITYSDVYTITIIEAPDPPTIECWENATFDDDTCTWIVTGSQPVQPITECWETATFNNTTCTWDVSGTQPEQPVLACWETASFNNTICQWEVSGAQPEEPTNLECWETAVFNTSSCTWEVNGSQPQGPTNLECWEVATFDSNSCSWTITGAQPEAPEIECWQTTAFNSVSCTWDILGTQPEAPSGLQCWEVANFNNTTCTWEVTGTQPEAPTNLQCWESTVFNSTTCVWDIIGTQPPEPADLECWEIATFNTITCSWEVTGSMPEEPTDLLCWQSTFFNDESCSWEIVGTQPINESEETLTLCEGSAINLTPSTDIINPSFSWSTGATTSTITVDTAGTYTVEMTDGCLTDIVTFNVNQIDSPLIENIYSDGSTIFVEVSGNGDYLYSINGEDYQFGNSFSNLPDELYTIYVKSSSCNFIVTEDYLHFYIQKFMTPNGDGVNDTFSLNSLSYYNETRVRIFDRYGKLLYAAENQNVNWDGTLNGSPIPSSDYWYSIEIDGQRYIGHFTLKR